MSQGSPAVDGVLRHDARHVTLLSNPVNHAFPSGPSAIEFAKEDARVHDTAHRPVEIGRSRPAVDAAVEGVARMNHRFPSTT
jgi:hypothetical protein